MTIDFTHEATMITNLTLGRVIHSLPTILCASWTTVFSNLITCCVPSPMFPILFLCGQNLGLDCCANCAELDACCMEWLLNANSILTFPGYQSTAEKKGGKSSVEGIASEQRCFMRWTAVPLDFIASGHNGVFAAGSHEGRKANPVLDLKPIDCGERSRCEPVSGWCSSCKLFLSTVCCMFIVCLLSISPTMFNIKASVINRQFDEWDAW